MHILYVIMTILFVTPAEALETEFIMTGEASFNLPHDLALPPDGRYICMADDDTGVWILDTYDNRFVQYQINE